LQQSPHRIQNIAVPTDFSPLARAAAARAATLARLDGAAIHLVHAIDVPVPVAPYPVSVPTDLREEIRRVSVPS
jgi:nucleotide-binding universal stress UspA family protein